MNNTDQQRPLASNQAASGIAVGMKVKAKGPDGWQGTILAIGATPDERKYRLKFMSRGAGDSGLTIWIDWGANVLTDKLSGRGRVAYGYPASVIAKLEVVN